MNTVKMLGLAAQVSRIKDDNRHFHHGAVGVRYDGVMVCAQNGAPTEPSPRHHCESRILRKLGKGGLVYLVRTLADGTWADSTPCSHCQKQLRAAKVNGVYYTLGPQSWSLWVPK